MKILILANHQSGLYRFRRELLERFHSEGDEVYISAPDGDFTEELKKTGSKVLIDKVLDRRGMNPLNDFKLLKYYKKLLNRVNPEVVLTYTIKPNIYGGFLCGKQKVPYIANVTGLGTSLENGGIIRKLILSLYKVGLKKADRVFFQNEYNLSFMLEHGVVHSDKVELLPGSGVNVEEHSYEPYPANDEKIIFTTIGRIMKDKGIDEILSAAGAVKVNHPNVIFRLIGDYDEDYDKKIGELQSEGIVEYIPFQKDIQPFIRESHAIIHASYHEGMSNVLLEAASSGRPVIATNVPGCIETFEPGVTGIAFESKDIESLISAIEEFLSLSHEQKEQMGREGRRKIEREFDRSIVIQKYLDTINGILV